MKAKTKKIKQPALQDFDPVEMMRDIRNKLTEEIMGMTHEQEIAYIQKLLSKK